MGRCENEGVWISALQYSHAPRLPLGKILVTWLEQFGWDRGGFGPNPGMKTRWRNEVNCSLRPRDLRAEMTQGLPYRVTSLLIVTGNNRFISRQPPRMSPLTNALLLLLLLLSLSALTIGFTEPASPLRPALLPVLILLVYRILPLCLPATNNVLLAALLASPSISFLFQYLDAALLSQWSFRAGGPTKDDRAVDQIPRKGKEKEKEMPWVRGRLKFGIYTATSPLYIGTPFEANGIPYFDAKDPTYVPSRARFLQQKAFVVLVCYLVLDAMTLVARPELNQILYHADRISMLNWKNWSEEQLGVRVGSTLGYWICLYCVVQAYMGVAGLLTVGMGASGVDLWRPAFGRVGEAWTVRRFWG